MSQILWKVVDLLTAHLSLKNVPKVDKRETECAENAKNGFTNSTCGTVPIS
jgi:hypothetical protein